jgi:hypothetical protein
MSSTRSNSRELRSDLARQIVTLNHQIETLKSIHREEQLAAFIKNDEVLKAMHPTESQALSVIKSRAAELTKNRKELEKTLSTIPFEVDTHSQVGNFFAKLPTDIQQYLYTFTDSYSVDLKTIDQQSYRVVSSRGYWRQLLQRDFGMPPQYFRWIIEKNDDEATAVFKLRTVYKRLAIVESRHPEHYKFYKTLLDVGINFLPLTSMRAPFPDFDTQVMLLYFNEALILEHVPLIEHILQKVFIENVAKEEFVHHFTVKAAVAAATIIKNKTLLNKIRDTYGEYSDVYDDVQLCIEVLTQEKLLLETEATQFLHDCMYYGCLDDARKLLENGTKPNERTLKLAFDYKVKNDFIFYLLNLSGQYPRLLFEVALNDEGYGNKLIKFLAQHADAKFVQHFWEIAYDNDLFKYRGSLFRALHDLSLQNAATQGDLAYIKRKQIDPERVEVLLRQAIRGGQLEVLEYLNLPQHFGVRALFQHYDAVCTVLEKCPHKNIVKHCVENLGVTQSTSSEENADSSRKRLSKLLQEWPIHAAKYGNLEVLNYFLHEAPQDFKLPAVSLILETAMIHNKEVIVQYIVEKLKQFPTPDNVEAVVSKKDNAARPYDFVISSICKQPEFRFAHAHVMMSINHVHANLAAAIAASPEFSTLFASLPEGDKNRFLNVVLAIRDKDYTMVSLKKIIALMPHSTAIDFETKLKCLATALHFQDEEAIKIFMNVNNKLWYVCSSWGEVNQVELENKAEFDFNAMMFDKPKLLAWFENEFKQAIPEARYASLSQKYVDVVYANQHSSVKRTVIDGLKEVSNQLASDVFLKAVNYYRQEFSDFGVSLADEKREYNANGFFSSHALSSSSAVSSVSLSLSRRLGAGS